MKIPLLSACLLAMPVCQAGESTPEGELVSLPARVDSSEAPPKPEPIDFEVLSSRSQRVNVVQAPPMEGLPPVTGTATVKVEMVADPRLPEPVPPLPQLSVEDAAVTAQIQEIREKHRGADFVFISATVYDHARTLLRILPNGQPDQEVAVWSNVDFNHFTGVGAFLVKEANGDIHDIGLVMGLGNESGMMKGSPRLPDLATAGPSFVVVKGSSAEALKSIERLHQLYRNDGARMKQSFLARTKACEAKKAALLATPPKPSDVTIRFWQRPEPVVQESVQP